MIYKIRLTTAEKNMKPARALFCPFAGSPTGRGSMRRPEGVIEIFR
jgi:hypothetical protein